MNETVRVTAGILAVPLLGTLFLIAYASPRYIPSEALARAAVEAGDGLPGREAVAATLQTCRSRVSLSPERLAAGSARIYSWENDEGLIAVTRIDCAHGESCSVSARALVSPPLGMRMWGCSLRGRWPIRPSA